MRALERTTKLLKSATLMGALACACTTISLPCLGQEDDSALPEIDERSPQMWTGGWADRLPAEGHPKREFAQRFAREQKDWWEAAQARVALEGPQAYAQLLELELAELLLDTEVGAIDPETYERRLGTLMVRGSRAEEFPGRWELLVKVKLELGKYCIEAGHRDLALLHTSRLLFPAGAILPPYELVPASDALLAQEAEALKDPGLEAFRSSVMQASAPAPAAVAPAQDSDLERKVRDALSMGQWDLVEELGSYAAEPLAAIVAESPDELPARERDALYWLFKYGELRGARLVLDLWDRPGIYFKKRVLRGIREAGVLSNPGTWTFVQMPKGTMELSTQPPRMEEPVWLDVLARLLADGEVARDSLGSVRYVAWLDGLDPRLQRGLMDALDRGDADMVKDVLAALENTQGRASVVPVLEHALEHSDPKVRVFAAERLALYPRNDELRARAADPDLRVRRAVADSVSGRVGQAAYRQDGNAFWLLDGNWLVRRSVDERDLPCLVQLLQDRDADIREQAVRALVENPDLTPPSEVLVRLVDDANPRVRAWLASWRTGRPADPALLERLAADPDPEVLKIVDERLDDLARWRMAEDGSTDVSLWNDTYLEALRIRMRNPALRAGSHQALSAAARTAVGANVVVSEAAAGGDPPVLRAAVFGLAEPDGPARELGEWDQVEGDVLLRFVEAVWDLPLEWDSRSRLLGALEDWPPESVRPLRAILADPGAGADLRIAAALLTAPEADDAWREQLLDVLPGSARPALGSLSALDLGELRDRLPDDQARKDLFVGLLRLDEPPEWVVRNLLPVLWPERTLPVELAVELIQRFGTRTEAEWSAPLSVALLSLEPAMTAEQPQLELVETLVANDRLDVFTLEILGRHPLDAYLPLLEDVLLARGSDTARGRGVMKKAAAAALASYLDDRAAEILLQGLGVTTDEEVRQALFAALETIRRYQDEKERWTRRRTSQQAREAAVAELVPMLADADANIRAQAARSMGALGAVEQLPALVRLLKDPAPEVRAAAQEAIDVLTRPAPADDHR